MVELSKYQQYFSLLFMTRSQEYVPLLIRYENHENASVRAIVKETLKELSKLD